jgi:hypothetical protein
MLKLRKAARQFTLRKRYNALTSREKLIAKQYEKLALQSFMISDIMQEDNASDEEIEL